LHHVAYLSGLAMSDRIDKLGMVRLSDQLPGLKKAKLAGCGHRKAADSGRVDMTEKA